MKRADATLSPRIPEVSRAKLGQELRSTSHRPRSSPLRSFTEPHGLIAGAFVNEIAIQSRLGPTDLCGIAVSNHDRHTTRKARHDDLEQAMIPLPLDWSSDGTPVTSHGLRRGWGRTDVHVIGDFPGKVGRLRETAFPTGSRCFECRDSNLGVFGRKFKQNEDDPAVAEKGSF